MAEVDAIAWRGDEVVLDVGCGDGAVTAQLAARVPAGRLLGVDVSSGQVGYARREHVAPNLAFEVQDAAHLRIPRGVDVVTSFNALHWVSDLPAALAALAAATVDGGRLVARVVVRAGERPSLEDVIAACCASRRWHSSFAGSDAPVERLGRERWIELLEAAGFVGVRAEVQESSWDFGSRAGFEDWLRANAGSWTQRVGGDQVEELLSDIVDRYEQVAGRAGLFWFTQLRLTAVRGAARIG